MLKQGVGYVAMTGGFNLTTADEFDVALKELHSKGMNMLVLDLRGNIANRHLRVAVADEQRERGVENRSPCGRARVLVAFLSAERFILVAVGRTEHRSIF